MVRALVLLAAAYCALAADDRVDDVNRILAPLRDTNGPGCAVGVMQNGRFLYKSAFGMADLDTRTPLTTDTAFNVASISKQFTAAAFYFLVESGKVRLTDSVRRFVPELPSYADAITVEDLLHHTSGLRDFSPLLEVSGRSEESLDLTASLKLLARQTSPNFSPGADYEYTNSDYLLLGLIIERISGMSLADFAQERLFGPLRMTNTQFYGGYQRLRLRAAGYAPRGNRFRKIAAPLLISGDGSLFTSIEDLLRWDENFYSGSVGGPAFVNFMEARGRLRNGRPLPYASGLIVGRYGGIPAISHPGELEGYRSEMIRFPGQRLTVAFLCNRGDEDSGILARRIANVYLGEKLRLARGVANIDYLSSGFPELDGVWESTQGMIARAWNAVDGLWLDLGVSQLKLQPLNQRQIFADTGSNRLILTKISRDEITLAWDRFPRTTYHRLTGAPPTAEDLGSLAGEYTSRDADARYQIVNSGGRLWIVGAAAWNVALEPVGADRFVAGAWALKFLRETGGRTQGLDLHCPRLWNLHFDRTVDTDQ